MAASTLLSADDNILGKKAGSKTSKSVDSEPPAQPPIKCPECHSSRIWKDGLRHVRSEIGTISVQCYICRDCGRRFSEDPSYLQPNRRGYNRISGPSARQVCVALAEGSKNLAEVKSRIEKRAAGTTTKPSLTDISGKIIQYSWYLKKQGYADGSDGDEGTVQKWAKILKRSVKLGANLWNPENVK